MGMGGAKAPPPAPLSVPRINKAAHTSCDNGSHVCAAPSPLTPAGQPLPPAVRSLQMTPGKVGGGKIGGLPCHGDWGGLRQDLGNGGCTSLATWGAGPEPAEVLFLWKRALAVSATPLCRFVRSPPAPSPGGGAAPGAAEGRDPPCSPSACCSPGS